MDVYYFVIFITFLLCYFIKVPANDAKAYRNKVIWVFVPILLYGAFRVDFGIDYSNYEEFYYDWHRAGYQIDEEHHVEVGYQWLNILVPSWRLLLIIVSTSVVGAFMMLYSKYVKPEMLLLAIFFTMFYPNQSFFMSFVTMRNGLTIAGVAWCLPLIIKRKYWLLIPISFGLSLIHTSALIFLPMAMIVGSNKALTKLEICIWVSVIALLTVIPTSDLMSVVGFFLIGDVFESYRDLYLEGDAHNSFLQCTANGILMCFVVSWAYRNKNKLTDSQNTIWRLSMLYLMSPFLGSVGRIRMMYYFILFYFITITYLVNDKSLEKVQKYIFIGLAITVMFYATYVVWMHNPYFVYEHYHSIFE